jgi:hypothetical protein
VAFVGLVAYLAASGRDVQRGHAAAALRPRAAEE